MTPADFDEQFNRLTRHFHLPADAQRDVLAMDWLQAVQHYHIDALDRAVTDLITDAEDRYWPALGKLLSVIRNRIAGMEKHGGTCQTCHGSTWVDDWPMKTQDNRVVTFMRRCPDCGVPAPQGGTSTYGLTRLTVVEKRIHDVGDWPVVAMEGIKPKPKHDPSELRRWCEATRARLFAGRF